MIKDNISYREGKEDDHNYGRAWLLYSTQERCRSCEMPPVLTVKKDLRYQFRSFNENLIFLFIFLTAKWFFRLTAGTNLNLQRKIFFDHYYLTLQVRFSKKLMYLWIANSPNSFFGYIMTNCCNQIVF